MPWKVKDTKIETDAAGNPIWIDDKGTEQPINAGELLPTITRLNGEAKTHRVAKEAAEKKLADFADLDPVKAKEALDKLMLIDQGKLIDSGKVDEVRSAIGKEYQAKLDASTAAAKALTDKLKQEKLTNAFATSPALKNADGTPKFIVPGDLLQKLFADKFDLKDDRIVALDANGNPMISAKNMGDVAGFDEAFDAIVNAYPGKDQILRGGNQGGTGNTGNGGTNQNKRTVSRAEEEKMPVAEKAEFMKMVREGKAQLVD